MSEYQKHSFCWSCGRSIESCICGKEYNPIEVTPPKTIMPVCGDAAYKDASGFGHDELLWLGPERTSEVMPRACCVCRKTWDCTFKEWIDGPCPNCGATGKYGWKKKEDLYNPYTPFAKYPGLAANQIFTSYPPKRMELLSVFELKSSLSKIESLHLDLNGDSSGEIKVSE